MIGIIYGALVAMVQPNMKKLVAYSSVSHLGFVVLGIFSFTQPGIERRDVPDAELTASRPARCSCWRACIYERRHTYEIAEMRRTGDADAEVRDVFPVRHAGLGGPAAAEWFRRRVPGAERSVSGESAGTA